jgi:mRNA (guanine-N7-)-methyltransferase
MDAAQDSIQTKLADSLLKHDLVNSQFVIHYSFETFNKADTFLKNVSDALKTGGYFIGTTTNACEIVARLRESETSSFGNDIYRIRFAWKSINKNPFL